MVMKELGISLETDYRIIEALNKSDLQASSCAGILKPKSNNEFSQIMVSGLTGDGLNLLLEGIDFRLENERRIFDLKISSSDGGTLAWLYKNGHVTDKLASG